MFQRLMQEAEAAAAGGGEEEVADESTAEEIASARQLGWVPQDEWKGDAANWKPAKEFLARGEEVMPLLKANNRRLHQQISTQNTQLSALQRQLAEQQEVIDALKEGQAEIAKDRREAQIEELTDQIDAAQEAGDRRLAAKLQAKLTNLTREADEAEEEETTGTRRTNGSRREPTAPPPQDFRESQWWKDWTEENTWYGEDRDKTDLADTVAMRMRQNPANASLTEKAFMDKVTQEVSRMTGTKLAGRSKVERTNDGGSGGGGGHSYADLPASAKAACDRQGKRLIGDKKGQFKDEKTWRAYYVQQFFGGERQ